MFVGNIRNDSRTNTLGLLENKEAMSELATIIEVVREENLDSERLAR